MTLAVAGCSNGGDDETNRDNLLDRFRAALPQDDVLRARAPSEETAAKGDNHGALVPPLAREEAKFVNELISDFVNEIRELTSEKPSSISDTESIWGPFEIENYPPYLFVTVSLNDAAEASHGFAALPYGYEVIRSMDPTLSPDDTLILEGASDTGIGFLYLDFQASGEFDVDNDTVFADDPTQGTAVAVYSIDQPAAESGDQLTFVTTSFRNIPVEGGAVEDFEHFYGTYVSPDQEYRWFAFDSILELENGEFDEVYVWMVHGLGAGRAEVEGFDSEGAWSVLECWDDALNQTLWLDDWIESDDQSACGPIYESTLTELGAPIGAGAMKSVGSALLCSEVRRSGSDRVIGATSTQDPEPHHAPSPSSGYSHAPSLPLPVA